MAKINLNIPLLDLNGNAVLEDNLKDTAFLNKRVAEVFYYGQTRSPLKYNNWALKLYNGEEIEVNEHEMEEIKQVIEASSMIGNFVKVAAINALDTVIPDKGTPPVKI